MKKRNIYHPHAVIPGFQYRGKGVFTVPKSLIPLPDKVQMAHADAINDLKALVAALQAQVEELKAGK